MKCESISLQSLRASEQPRPLLTEAIDKLAASMRQIGLIQPITVRHATVMRGIAEDGYRIVAGHHRVAAARALGWARIDAIVLDAETSHLAAELLEIDENLCRAELSAAQRAQQIGRRKQIWEALHPEAKAQRVADLSSGKSFPETHQISTRGRVGEGRPAEFASETAGVAGITKRSINQHLARATALGDEALRRISGTSLDKGTELDALSRMTDQERAALVAKAEAGEQVSAVRDSGAARLEVMPSWWNAPSDPVRLADEIASRYPDWHMLRRVAIPV